MTEAEGQAGFEVGAGAGESPTEAAVVSCLVVVVVAAAWSLIAAQSSSPNS